MLGLLDLIKVVLKFEEKEDLSTFVMENEEINLSGKQKKVEAIDLQTEYIRGLMKLAIAKSQTFSHNKDSPYF